MHQNLKAILVFASIAGLSLAAPATVDAQPTILAKVVVSGTLYEQSTIVTDNGTTTTTKAPTKSSFTTAMLLKQLALDEYAEQSWSASKFPANASLVFNGTGFQVDQGTNELVDVSDILTWNVTGTNDISTGSYLDVNSQQAPPFTETDYQLVTVTYKDSSSTGALTFSVTGLATITGKATNPNAKTGNFTQSASLSLQDGTGEGLITTNSTPFVLTGFTISASGSAAGNNGAGTDDLTGDGVSSVSLDEASASVDLNKSVSGPSPGVVSTDGPASPTRKSGAVTHKK